MPILFVLTVVAACLPLPWPAPLVDVSFRGSLGLTAAATLLPVLAAVALSGWAVRAVAAPRPPAGRPRPVRPAAESDRRGEPDGGRRLGAGLRVGLDRLALAGDRRRPAGPRPPGPSCSSRPRTSSPCSPGGPSTSGRASPAAIAAVITAASRVLVTGRVRAIPPPPVRPTRRPAGRAGGRPAESVPGRPADGREPLVPGRVARRCAHPVRS